MHGSKFDATARPIDKKRCFPSPNDMPKQAFPPLHRRSPGGFLGEHRPRQHHRLDQRRRIDQIQSLAGPRHEQSPLSTCTIKSGQDSCVPAATPPSCRLSRVSTRNVQTHQQTAQTYISSRQSQPSRVFCGPILSRPDRLRSHVKVLFLPLPMSRMTAAACQPRDAIPHQKGVENHKGPAATALSSGPWIHTYCSTQYVAGCACPSSKYGRSAQSV